MQRNYALTILFLLAFGPLAAQLSLQDGTTDYLINFDATVSGVNAGTFSGNGFTTSPGSGQLDADAWATTGLSDGSKPFGTNNSSGDHARGLATSPVSSGGIYAFDLGGGNRALGIQPTGSDWTPGTLTLKVVNNSTTVVDEVTVDYQINVRNDQTRASAFEFAYSLNNSTYVDVPAADYLSPANSSGTAWVAVGRSVSLSGLGLSPGASLYLRWSGGDVSGSGGRDEFALDDISLSVAGTPQNCVEPAAQATGLNFGTVTSSSVQASFTGSGADKYLVLQSTNSSLGGNPVDGTLYAVGNTLGNGTVIGYDAATAFNASGLTASTTYHYFVFAANDNCNGGPDYRTVAPLTGSVTTDNNGGGGGGGGYYDGIGNQSCADLKTALHNLIDGHTVVSYGSLWTYYQTTDDRLNDAGTATIVWDMYSDNPGGSEHEFTFVTDQCGNYQGEGDCYNREHSFPKSWWGGSTSQPQYTDIFTVVPSDGWVNSVRSNYPFGNVQPGTETQVTANGTALGSSTVSIPGYSGPVFEPIDAYKGDFARGYFYMATRYENNIAGWENNTTESDAVLSGDPFTVFEPWVVDLLLDWHLNDPVSQKEVDRNEAIFGIQGNRNPFIDHPEYVDLIWGNGCGGSGGGDTQAPTAPTALGAANVTETTLDLNWNASTDNVGVTGYRVYQDDVLLQTVTGTAYGVNGLTAATAYDFYVIAIDAAGNASAASSTLTATTASPPANNVLHEGYFETGLDGWTDGGSDCARYSGRFAPEGAYAMRIRDNSGTASSMTSPTFDLSAFNSVTVDFSFYANSMENGEDFWLRYYNGSSWQTVATYVRGTDFNNGIFYAASITLDATQINFAPNARFRFQCDASGNNDQIYVDEVVITGGSGGARATNPVATAAAGELATENALDREQRPAFAPATQSLILSPNPATDRLRIDWSGFQGRLVRMDLIDALGRRIRELRLDEMITVSDQDVSDLIGGLYYLRAVDALGSVHTTPFVVK